LYTAGKEKITAFDLGKKPAKRCEPVWTTTVNGNVHHMLAADERLFVMTTDARLYCFGTKKVKSVSYELNLEKMPESNDEWTRKVAGILKRKENRSGYAVLAGIHSGRLI